MNEKEITTERNEVRSCIDERKTNTIILVNIDCTTTYSDRKDIT
jgi:hypothetical protein